MGSGMQIAVFIALVIIGVFLIRWLMSPTRSGPVMSGERERRSHRGNTHPFYAVSIESETTACSLAESLKSRRFLSDEAPGLPLPGCSEAQCSCKYQHHADRRDGARDRRLGEIADADTADFWRLRGDRRRGGGRREEDLVAT